jgi:hypothetical protein
MRAQAKRAARKFLRIMDSNAPDPPSSPWMGFTAVGVTNFELF